MIFHTKEYELLLKALKSHFTGDNSENQIMYVLDQLDTTSYNKSDKDCVTIPKRFKELAIATGDCSSFPKINVGLIKHVGYYSMHNFFPKADRNVYKIICDTFIENGIDLPNNIQESISKNKINYEMQYFHNSKNYINYVLKTNYKYNVDQLDHLLDALSKLYQKEVQPSFLNLLLKKIEDNQDQDKILSQLKTFIKHSSAITASSEKSFSLVKEKIKDWDLKKHFILSEIKMLYSGEGGIVLKRTETLYYNFNYGLIRKKTKVLQNVLNSNLSLLCTLIPEEFGKLPEFILLSKKFSDSNAEINILFEKNVKESILSSLETLIENTINESIHIEKDVLKKKVASTLFCNILDENLDKKNEVKPVRKNKI